MNTKKYKREIILRLDKNKITTYNEIKIVNRNNICIYTFIYDTRIFDKHVHSRSYVLNNNFHGRVPRRDWLLQKKLFVTKDNTFWRKIFPDESKFNTFNSDRRNYVWRGANTVEHSDSVMVWLVAWQWYEKFSIYWRNTR